MSLQLDRYLAARASGASPEQASARSGIPLAEAKLTEKAIEKGEVEMPHVRVCACEDQSTEEEAMANDNSTKEVTGTGLTLQRYIERAERLDAEIKDLNADKSELFKEMKSNGFDAPTIKRIIKLRKMEPHARREAEALLSTYIAALGMTPIEQAIALAA